jgi:hypothetical protein
MRLFTSNPSAIDDSVRKEMIRLRSRREAQEKYRSMKLFNLIHPSKKEDRSA